MADGNPRVVIGDNKPPKSPYEAVKAHCDDLLVEARAWADGASVETQAQADEISRLMEDLRLAATAADDARKVENKPHDDAKAAVQARYNVYLADLKAKTMAPGKIPVALDALKKTLTPWLLKLEAEQLAIAAEARRVADEAAKVAADAMRASDATNLEGREAAEELVSAAAKAAADASRAAGQRAHASGGSRAIGLRSEWVTTLTDRRAAVLHYLTVNPNAFEAFLLGLAKADVASGKRTVPGFAIVEDRHV